VEFLESGFTVRVAILMAGAGWRWTRNAAAGPEGRRALAAVPPGPGTVLATTHRANPFEGTTMNSVDTFKLYQDRFRPEEMPIEYYGIELSPKTLESLVTWDVSGHAQCEKDRLSSIYRTKRTTRGGY
jgi:hypothetical protein